MSSPHVHRSGRARSPDISTPCFPAPCQVHLAYENNFWATKMALKVGGALFVSAPAGPHSPLMCGLLHCPWQGNSTDELARTKTAYESFLGDSAKLASVREALKVRSSSVW